MQWINKNNALQLFRTTSLLALLLFLVFWLNREYQDQYTILEKDVNIIFDDIMHDVLFEGIMKQAEIVDNAAMFINSKNDTVIKIHPPAVKQKLAKIDTLKKAAQDFVKKVDSTTSHNKLSIVIGGGDKKAPFKNSTKDVKRVAVKAFSFVVTDDELGDTTIIQNMPKDTLDIVVLKNRLSDSLLLNLAQFDVNFFRLNKVDTIAEKDGIITNLRQGDFSSENKYYAQVQSFNLFLLQKIYPQILFSIFLFSITAFTFWIIYRNFKQQQQLTAIKNEFIANITHELKTPITTVGVALEAISDFEVLKDPERTKEYLQISRNELGRLNLLVDKVLQLSKLEKQAPKLKIESLSIDELVEQILQSMKLQFEKEKALVEFYKLNKEVEVEGDRMHLTSVIYNLVDNALKYCKQNPKITIKLEDLGERIKLIVKDNGIGIPQAYQKKIFEKFFRIPTGDQHNVKGHGLGLNYVFNIIQQHQGNIELESKEGSGSTFAVVIPKYQ